MFEQVSTQEWVSIIVGVLLVVSEALPFSQKIKSNGIVQSLFSLLKFIAGKNATTDKTK